MKLQSFVAIILLPLSFGTVFGWTPVDKLPPKTNLSMAASEGKTAEVNAIRVLGVCGGIGSGKSQACKLLVSDLGCISHIGMCHIFDLSLQKKSSSKLLFQRLIPLHMGCTSPEVKL